MLIINVIKLLNNLIYDITCFSFSLELCFETDK